MNHGGIEMGQGTHTKIAQLVLIHLVYLMKKYRFHQLIHQKYLILQLVPLPQRLI